MLILGVETSCDETAAAIVEDGRRVRANVVASQIATHALYGGVVPEVASRQHVATIVPVIERAVADAGLTFDALDAIAGATRRDAAGEAFDKVGKLLGLGYPGGVAIDKAAATGDVQAFALPRALPGRDDLDFSFSGLKTAVATLLARREALPQGQEMNDF